MPLPDTLPDGEVGMPSPLRSFEATVPSADSARARRRATRNVDAPRFGLKHLPLGTRGFTTERADEAESEEDVVVVFRERWRRGRKKRGRESLSANRCLDAKSWSGRCVRLPGTRRTSTFGECV